MGTRFLILVLFFSLVLLAGCSANRKAIYHFDEIDSYSSLTTVDAKQRAILSTWSVNDSTRRFCSEPSPDVFSVVAQALSVGGAFGQSADPASIEAALNMAFSDAEQGSTIPRTQTINMLRELMFRTCERYLSGAYTDLDMSVQAVRDQRLMVSILAIEQLTGAVAPKPVVIGAGGGATAGPGSAAVVRLDDAFKTKNAAGVAHEKAKKAFAELNTDQGDGTKLCDAIAEAVEEGRELTGDQKQKEAKCNDARTARASAKEHLVKSSDHYTDLKRLAAVSGVSVSTNLNSSAPGGIDRAHDYAVAGLSEKVKEIVELNFDERTEVILFCFKRLSPNKSVSRVTDGTDSDVHDKLRSACVEYLESSIKNQAWKENLSAKKQEEKVKELEAQMAVSAQNLEKFDRKYFDDQWNYIDRLAKGDRLNDFVDRLKVELFPFEANKAHCFLDAESREDFFACFSALPSYVKRRLPEVD